MKKVKFIYNPRSGESKIHLKIDDVIKIYQRQGYSVVPYRVDFKCDLKSAFYDIDDNYDHILISGGDGTIDRVVNLMMNSNIDLPIGILPTGTANDFAKMLGISDDIEQNIHRIISLKPKKIDVGKINDKYFVNVASTGMFTDVSQKINKEFKNSMGKLSYYIKGIEQALNLRKFNISVISDEITYDGDMYFMVVFNGRMAGNINLAYKSEIDDGLLDVIIFKAMPIAKTLQMFIKVMKQEHLEQQADIVYFRTDKLSIICTENISTDIDGEKGPDFPLHIECEREALKVLGINRTFI